METVPMILDSKRGILSVHSWWLAPAPCTHAQRLCQSSAHQDESSSRAHQDACRVSSPNAHRSSPATTSATSSCTWTSCSDVPSCSTLELEAGEQDTYGRREGWTKEDWNMIKDHRDDWTIMHSRLYLFTPQGLFVPGLHNDCIMTVFHLAASCCFYLGAIRGSTQGKQSSTTVTTSFCHSTPLFATLFANANYSTSAR